MKDLLFKHSWNGLLYCGGCLAVCAVWALIYGIPRVGEIRSNRLELKEAKTTYAQLLRVADSFPRELEALSDEEERLENTLAALPREEDIPAVTRSFTERAVSNGLDVVAADLEIGTIFGSNRVKEESRISIVPFTLVVQGRYRNIGRFLEDMAERGVYVECKSLVISRIPDVQGIVEATISLNLYAFAGRPSRETCEADESGQRAGADGWTGVNMPRPGGA